MLTTYPDWILPLRIRVTGGAKLAPCTLAQLAALNRSWRKTTGVPERYSANGFDLLSLYKQPTSATSLDITYARSAVALVNSSDVPEIPTEHHPALIDGAIPILRAKEGGQEWQKVLPNWDRFLAAAKKMGDYVRARNQERGYDRMPMELARFDSSSLLKGMANV